MQLTPETIFEAAMALPESERLDLASRLMDTVPPDIMSTDDPDFVAELERRFNDGAPTIPWSEIRDRK
jgi:putative addiction module component (TIGR02574 family)